MNYGALQVVRIDSSAPYSVEVLVHEALPDSYGKVFVEVDSAPPYGITGVWLIPFVMPSPEYNTPRPADGALAAVVERYAARLAERDVFSGASR